MAKYDIKKKEHRERLVNTFVNAIFLYDDSIYITFNYGDSTDAKTVTLDDLKCSDLVDLERPNFDRI